MGVQASCGVLDDQVWEHARVNGFAIVTKDEEYSNLSVVRGSLAKVLWLQVGNCTTAQVEAVAVSWGPMISRQSAEA